MIHLQDARAHAIRGLKACLESSLHVKIFKGKFPYCGQRPSPPQGMTPGVTMLISVGLGQEQASVFLLMALCMIGGGTGIAVLIESGTNEFRMRGFIFFMISSVTESLRVTFMQVRGHVGG